jgi:hypothetical protein
MRAELARNVKTKGGTGEGAGVAPVDSIDSPIRFAQTDLQDYHNLNVVSKVRAGRVLGRCHAMLGQHTLSVSAFDAAIELAQSRKLLLSEALSVRGRAATGRNGAEGNGLHWNEEMGKQRLAEVMERVLVLPR